MLRLHIVPEGYIYPKEGRPIRDMLRKRGHLVKIRNSLVISLQNIITRNNGVRIKGELIKALTTDHAAPFLEANEDLALAGKVSKASIDFLTRQIKAIEANIEEKVALREPYAQLVTIHGVGKILGSTIMLEAFILTSAQRINLRTSRAPTMSWGKTMGQVERSLTNQRTRGAVRCPLANLLL